MSNFLKILNDNFKIDQYLKYSENVYFIKLNHFNCINGNSFTVALCQDENGVYLSDLANVQEEIEEEKGKFVFNETINKILETYKIIKVNGEFRLYIDQEDMFNRYFDNFVQAQSIIYFLFSIK